MSQSGTSTPATHVALSPIKEAEQDPRLGFRPAQGYGAAPLAPIKFRHGFWDPEVTHLRKLYLKLVGRALLLTIVMMWLSLPVYWGSLGESQQHAPKLNGWLVNRDGDNALGQAMIEAFEAHSRGVGVPEHQHLTWIVANPEDFPSNEDVIDGVVDEKVWAAVVVNADATLALSEARAFGNSSYDPQSAVTFYYIQGRQEAAANTYINPYTTALLQTTLARFGERFTAQWLLTANQDDIAAAAQAPQTIATPFSFTSVNIRPFTKPVSTAIFLIGMIFMTIVCFMTASVHDAARGVVGPFLTFKSYAKLRIATPLVLYVPLSFSFAMISLPFKVTFGERYGYGGGFFIFWLFAYMTIASLGLGIEAMIPLLTPRYTPYFVLLLVIFNVSVANVPIILQPGFYRYGHAFQFYNFIQAVRAIIFDTKSHLGLNAGVLIGWIALNCCTITLFTWIVRRRAMKGKE